MATNKHPRPSRKYKKWIQAMDRKTQRQRRAARVLRECFGMHSQAVPPIDESLCVRLRSALGQIDFDLTEACYQRGILPQGMAEDLYMARFLAYVLPAARGAQSITRIPASILIADAFLHTAGSVSTNDVFGTGKEFRNIFDSFLDRAVALRRNRKLKAEVFGDRDVQSYISQHNLTRCDALQANGY